MLEPLIWVHERDALEFPLLSLRIGLIGALLLNGEELRADLVALSLYSLPCPLSFLPSPFRIPYRAVFSISARLFGSYSSFGFIFMRLFMLLLGAAAFVAAFVLFVSTAGFLGRVIFKGFRIEFIL